MADRLPPAAVSLLADRSVVTTAQLRAAGLSAREIARLSRRGPLVRLRRGAYADARAHAARDERGRHRVLTAAVVGATAPPAVASHQSAAVLLGLDLLDPDLRLVQLTRGTLHTPRTEGGVVHHAAELPADHVTVVDGIAVTTRARTAVDVARDRGYRAGAVTIDAALRAGVRPEELRSVLELCASWPGARDAGRAVAFGNGRSESGGETLSRVTLAEIGVRDVQLQVVIRDRGQLVARVDFLIGMTVVEFDGRLKYGVPDGASPAEAAAIVWREKLREDRLRDLGYEVVRLVWADLFRPAEVSARLVRAFARAEARHRQAS